VAALALDENRDRHTSNTQLVSKSARAYAKTYKPGPPLVPAIIVRRISEYINRIRIRKKQEFIQQMCRYWSLKREVRRGAPLLKRLHLEPWTANAGMKQLTEEEQLMRLDVSLFHLCSLTSILIMGLSSNFNDCGMIFSRFIHSQISAGNGKFESSDKERLSMKFCLKVSFRITLPYDTPLNVSCRTCIL
jgi:hypothetical protein